MRPPGCRERDRAVWIYLLACTGCPKRLPQLPQRQRSVSAALSIPSTSSLRHWGQIAIISSGRPPAAGAVGSRAARRRRARIRRGAGSHSGQPGRRKAMRRSHQGNALKEFDAPVGRPTTTATRVSPGGRELAESALLSAAKSASSQANSPSPTKPPAVHPGGQAKIALAVWSVWWLREPEAADRR